MNPKVGAGERTNRWCRRQWRWIGVVGIILLSAGLITCKKSVPRDDEFDPNLAEISPGVFIYFQQYHHGEPEKQTLETMVKSFWNMVIMDRPREWVMLKIPWGRQTVTYFDASLPISIREHRGRLYLVGYDRSRKSGYGKLRYFRQEGAEMKEIHYLDYPPQIAIQNQWLGADDFQSTPQHLSEADLAIRAHPGDPGFDRSFTASIWWHLMTGINMDKREFETAPSEVLNEFVRRHRPIRLTQILPGHVPAWDWQPPGDADDEGAK